MANEVYWWSWRSTASSAMQICGKKLCYTSTAVSTKLLTDIPNAGTLCNHAHGEMVISLVLFRVLSAIAIRLRSH